jgi:hypothetical protein
MVDAHTEAYAGVDASKERHTFMYLPRMKSWPQTSACGMLVDL